MKKGLPTLLIIIFTLITHAQEQTLISGDVESGGFGGPVLKFTRINGENAVLLGGRGGWIINHSFALGGGGYGLVTNVNAKIPDSTHSYIEIGYGGLDLEYIASSNDLIHLSLGLLVGGGGAGYNEEDEGTFNHHHKMNGFFILEPSIHANLNMTHFFRIAAGMSYRYISGLNSRVSTDIDLSGPSAILTFKFGKF